MEGTSQATAKLAPRQQRGANGSNFRIFSEGNPSDVEQTHAMFVGGPNVPARVRLFVAFLAANLRERLASSPVRYDPMR